MKKITALLLSTIFIINIMPLTTFASESVISSQNDFYELYETDELTCQVFDENGDTVPFKIINHEVSSVSPLSLNDNEITETHTLDFVTYATNHTESTYNDDVGNHVRATLTIRYSTNYNSSGNVGYLINSVTISHSDISGQAIVTGGELNVSCKGLAGPDQVRNVSYTSYNYTYITNFTEYAYENDWNQALVRANSISTLEDITNGYSWTLGVSWNKI